MTHKPEPPAPTIKDFGLNAYVVVRCHWSGVQFGKLIQRNGQEVLLKRARRIWSWKGANTISELVTTGPAYADTYVSEPLPYHLLLDAVEVVPCTAEAKAVLLQCGWGAQKEKKKNG